MAVLRVLVATLLALAVCLQGVQAVCRTSGHYSSSTGTCIPCLAGYYSPDGLTCSQCPQGTYQPNAQSAACIDCPSSLSTSPIGATVKVECVCAAGSYMSDSADQYSCSSCPEGASCDGASELPVSKEGYFTSDSEFDVFLQCSPSESCLGNDVCGDRYEEYLCASCTDNHRRWYGRCLTCPSPVALPAIFSFFGYIALALCLLWASRNPHYAVPYIFLNFLHLGAILPKLVANFSDSLRSALELLSIFNLSIEWLSVECYGDISFGMRYALSILVPLLVMVAVFAGVSLAYKFKKRHELSAVTFRSTLIHCAVIFACNAYSFMAEASFAFFDCTSQPDGSSTLDADPSILCFSGEWAALFPLAFVPIVLYVIGVPVFLFWNLRKNVDYLGDREVMSKYGWLYLRYRNNAWWWEFVIFARKLFIVGCITMFSTFVAGMVLPLFAILLNLVAQMRKRPFRRSSADNAETFVLFMEFTMVFCVTLFQYADNGDFSPDKGTTSSMTVFVFVVAILGLFAFAIMEVKKVRSRISASLKMKPLVDPESGKVMSYAKATGSSTEAYKKKQSLQRQKARKARAAGNPKKRAAASTGSKKNTSSSKGSSKKVGSKTKAAASTSKSKSRAKSRPKAEGGSDGRRRRKKTTSSGSGQKKKSGNLRGSL